jgi:hypothetical protein
MKGEPKTASSRAVSTALCAILLLAGCRAQWVSPYNADLQRRATDMLSDVVAWEAHMRSVAGTAAADPRNPDVQARLETWRGHIEAMSEIEIGIDPGATACDAVLARISGTLSDTLKKALPTAPAAASSATKPITYCETLPGIFTRMMQQVSDSTDTPPRPAVIPLVLDQQCKLPWLSEDYFASLGEGRAIAGASSPARPASASAKPASPTKEQQSLAIRNCRALFVSPPGQVHGNLVHSLVVDLDAVIYREGRQAPPT